MEKFAKLLDKIAAALVVFRVALVFIPVMLIFLTVFASFYPTTTFVMLIVLLTTAIAVPLLVYLTNKSKDASDYQTLLIEKQALQANNMLAPIVPSIDLVIDDVFYFERPDTVLKLDIIPRPGSIPRASQTEKTGTLLLTDKRIIFASDTLSVIPFELLGGIAYEPYKKAKSQVVLKLTSLANTDKLELLVPIADEELLRTYLSILINDFRLHQQMLSVGLPYTNTCPRCAAPLKDGHCEYCGWSPPLVVR
ncbi:MAG: hypothetical protein FWH40_08235 [Coriobacteriia bacterium]|nr:hypothetical protein [Coriobacteriia bacterium]